MEGSRLNIGMASFRLGRGEGYIVCLPHGMTDCARYPKQRWFASRRYAPSSARTASDTLLYTYARHPLARGEWNKIASNARSHGETM